jgi:phytoene synthase
MTITMDPFDHCAALVREADRDRFLATLFAPARCRPALFALYAFNVEVTRVREVARQPLPGELRLQWWRDALAGREEARAHPVTAALLDAVARYRLPAQALVELIDAHAFDLYDEPMQTVAELEDYAIRTAAALKLLAARVMCDGNDPGIARLDGCLGIAQVLTAVLATLPLHAARGQLYVPLELLREKGARAEDAFAGRATVELRQVLADLRLRARRHLSEARSLLAAAPGAVAPALLTAALIRPTLDRMVRRSGDPFRPPVLAPWRRQWILWRAARKGLAAML